MKLILHSSSCETMAVSAAWGCWLVAPLFFQLSVQAMNSAGRVFRKSPTALGPSATNTPSRCLFFFSSSERMYFILALLIIFAKLGINVEIEAAP